MKDEGKQRDRDAGVREAASPDGAHGALRAQGQRTRGVIVEAARALLLEGGSLEFTLREIAQRAGICISNLQYYFPTRLAVLHAVFEAMIDAGIHGVQRVTEQSAAPRETLSLVVAGVLQEARNTECSALWCHFLSLAAIDPASAQLLDKWYDTVVREVARLAATANPALTGAGSRATASLLIAMMEGVSMRIGVELRNRADSLAMDARVLAAVDALLDMPPLRSPRRH